MNTTVISTRARRAGAVLCFFALVAAGCSSDGANTARLSDGAIIADSGVEAGDVETDASGEPVNFRWDNLDDEFTTALSDLPAGTPVVLNFFASWCPSCIAEMPDFENVSQSFGDDVRFIGLAMQDRPESARALVAETGVSYLVGADPNGDVYAQFGGIGMPTTVFIDADGRVTSVFSGPLNAEALTDKITDELLQES